MNDCCFTVCIFLLLIAGSAFADCIGYTDLFNVRVLDAKYRPIEGAEVTVKYDRGATFGEKYYTTPVQLTNSQGMVYFELYNQGTLTRPIDCSIAITGSAGGRTVTKAVTALEHGNIVDVVLTDVYPVQFYVRDQYRAPLANASVTLNGATEKTDKNGRIEYLLKTGSYSYLASYLEGQQAGTFSVSDDTSYEVLLNFYRITIRVIDDFGEPLDAGLVLLNDTYDIRDGFFEKNKTFGEEIRYEISYQGIIKEGVIEPASEPHITIVYDNHAPTFESITSETINDKARLTVKVSDGGQYASGVDFQSIKITYRVEPADATTPWTSAVTFTTGRDAVAAEFPELAPGSLVNFRAEIKDREGNKATVDGTFTTTPLQNQTQTQTNSHEEPQPSQEIPLIYIVGGVIVVILFIYFVIKIKRKATESA